MYCFFVDSRVLNPLRENVWPIHVIDLNCTGDEVSIWDCPLNGVLSHNCNSYSSRDASLACAGL